MATSTTAVSVGFGRTSFSDRQLVRCSPTARVQRVAAEASPGDRLDTLPVPGAVGGRLASNASLRAPAVTVAFLRIIETARGVTRDLLLRVRGASRLGLYGMLRTMHATAVWASLYARRLPPDPRGPKLDSCLRTAVRIETDMSSAEQRPEVAPQHAIQDNDNLRASLPSSV